MDQKNNPNARESMAILKTVAHIFNSQVCIDRGKIIKAYPGYGNVDNFDEHLDPNIGKIYYPETNKFPVLFAFYFLLIASTDFEEMFEKNYEAACL